MDIPDWLLTFTVTVETCTGHGPRGAVYAAPAEYPCFKVHKRRMVRTAVGDEVTSDLTVILKPGLTGVFTPESRVTIDNASTVVIGAVNNVDGGLGAPQHTEVWCE